MTITLNLSDSAAHLVGRLIEDSLKTPGFLDGPDSPEAQAILRDIRQANGRLTSRQPTLMQYETEPLLDTDEETSATADKPSTRACGEQNDHAGVISRYTREAALADGVLVDVSEMARGIGYDLSVALTGELASDISDVPPRCASYQDPVGRQWDVLYTGFLAMRELIQRNKDLAAVGSRQILETTYDVQLPVGPANVYKIKLAFSVEDNHPQPVITLMKPGEN